MRSCEILWGWGHGGYGQLGLGHAETIGDDANEMGDHLLAVDLGGSAQQVAAGAWHSCALLEDFSVKCWGAGLSTLPGIGPGTPRAVGKGWLLQHDHDQHHIISCNYSHALSIHWLQKMYIFAFCLDYVLVSLHSFSFFSFHSLHLSPDAQRYQNREELPWLKWTQSITTQLRWTAWPKRPAEHWRFSQRVGGCPPSNQHGLVCSQGRASVW